MKGYLRWFNAVDQNRVNTFDLIRAELQKIPTDSFPNSKVAESLKDWQEEGVYASNSFRARVHFKEVLFGLYNDYDGIHVIVGGATIHSTNPDYVRGMANLVMQQEMYFRAVHAGSTETPACLKFYDFRPYSYLAKVTDKSDGSYILQVSDNTQAGRVSGANLADFHFSRRSETRRYESYDKIRIFWEAATLMADRQAMPYWSAFPLLRDVIESPQTNTKLLLIETTRSMTYQYTELDGVPHIIANNEIIRI